MLSLHNAIVSSRPFPPFSLASLTSVTPRQAPDRERPLPSPFTAFRVACAHPLVPLAIGAPAATCLLRATAREGGLPAPLRRRRVCGAPSRQRASHVTASQARSACSRSSVYFPPFLPTWSLLETERSLPALWRRKSKLQNWSLGRREALPGEAGLGPGPGISADKY